MFLIIIILALFEPLLSSPHLHSISIKLLVFSNSNSAYKSHQVFSSSKYKKPAKRRKSPPRKILLKKQ